MQKKSARLSAFSMVELSVVLTIIAVIVIGTIKSQGLVSKARLSNAQTLTQNTPVKDMDGMVAWFETSLETSFLFNEEVDGGQISEWRDNNPNAASRNNATQTTTGFRPKFYQAVLNSGIPVLRFDGVDDVLNFDGSGMVGTSYTIFVVEQRRSNKSSSRLISGGSGAVDPLTNITIGYFADSLMISHYSVGDSINYTLGDYTEPTPRIHTFGFSQVAGQRYWLNGGVAVDAENTATEAKAALISFAGATVGRGFEGDIAEVIIFGRALQTNERQVVEDYLSKKYAITIS